MILKGFILHQQTLIVTYSCYIQDRTIQIYSSTASLATQFHRHQCTFPVDHSLYRPYIRPSTDISIHNNFYRIYTLWLETFHVLSTSLDILFVALYRYQHMTRSDIHSTTHQPASTISSYSHRM